MASKLFFSAVAYKRILIASKCSQYVDWSVLAASYSAPHLRIVIFREVFYNAYWRILIDGEASPHATFIILREHL